MKQGVLALTVLALCCFILAKTLKGKDSNARREAASLLAQNNAAQAAPHNPLSPADCSFTFTSGANNTFLKYCITANGNITVFQTPAGLEHFAVGAAGEGYGICDTTVAGNTVAYDDYAEFGDSGNWGTAVVLSHNSKSVKIARSTSDGIWTLTQTFTQVVAGTTPSVKISMALKNNSAVDRQAFLIRYADVDADGQTLNRLDATANSAFGWSSDGVVLQNVDTAPVPNIAFAQGVPNGPSPCNPFNNFIQGPVTNTDGSLAMIYFYDLAKGASKTVTVAYKGL